MNKYENGVIRYQLDFEKYKNGQAEEIVKLLDRADSDIAGYIKKTNGVYTKARYNEISRKLKDISKALKKQVGDKIDVDGVIDYELRKEKKLFGEIKNDLKKVKGGTFNFIYPDREQIKTAALFRPATEGLTYDSYLNGIEDGLFNIWDSAVRTGYLIGKPTKQIVSDVMGGVSPETKLKNPGLINPLRNSIYGNTRTLLQSFAEETRERVYKENEDYFGDGKDGYKYEYLATLDNRTCIVCGNVDGKLYKSIKDAPSVPQHRNCRCLLIPYFDIEGDTRASKNGYIDSRITFDDWLKEQDEKTQKDVLGATRYAIYKHGKNIKQFIDDGKVKTLNELMDDGYYFFKKSEPMTYEEAIKDVNPYDDSYNCQACSVAFEAKMRGYRGVYAPKFDDNDYCKMLSRDYSLAWLNEKGEHPQLKPININSYDYNEFVKQVDESVKEGSRYAFGFRWTDGEKIHGHIVNAMKIDGKLRFIDSQTYDIYDKSLLENCIFGKYIEEKYKPFLLKCDKLRFDEDFVEKLLEGK